MPPNKRRGTLQGGLPTSTYVPESAAVITIQGSKIIFAPVQDVLKETDMKNRRGKSVWWRVRPCRRGLLFLPPAADNRDARPRTQDIRALVELMGGRRGMAEGGHHSEA
jgi:hypothetical protein